MFDTWLLLNNLLYKLSHTPHSMSASLSGLIHSFCFDVFAFNSIKILNYKVWVSPLRRVLSSCDESQVIYLFFCIIFPIECQESSKQQGFTDPVDQRWSFTDHWLWYGEKVWSQLVILGTVFVTVRITESVPLCTVRCIKLTPKTRDTAGRKLFYSCI